MNLHTNDKLISTDFSVLIVKFDRDLFIEGRPVLIPVVGWLFENRKGC